MFGWMLASSLGVEWNHGRSRYMGFGNPLLIEFVICGSSIRCMPNRHQWHIARLWYVVNSCKIKRRFRCLYLAQIAAPVQRIDHLSDWMFNLIARPPALFSRVFRPAYSVAHSLLSDAGEKPLRRK
jgi:hypothetical protein